MEFTNNFNNDCGNNERDDDVFLSDLNSPHIDEVLNIMEEEPRWRSLAVSSGYNHEYEIAARGFVEPAYIPSSSSSKVKAPEQPFYLAPTHFKVTTQQLPTIVFQVNSVLEEISEVSFQFNEAICEWTGVYMRASSCCKFEIHIYSSCGAFLVEANRLSGDCSAFRQVYSDLKELLDPSFVISSNYNDSFSTTSLPLPTCLQSEEEICSSLQPIVRIAREQTMDAQIEASRMLCQLSYHDSMQQQLCDAGCIQVLYELARCEWDVARQNAIFALANLSAAPSCQVPIIESGVVGDLLELSVDGPFYSAEMRSEGARILANLSTRLASNVVDAAGTAAVASWLSKIDTMQDKRLKLHADRAKQSLVKIDSISSLNYSFLAQAAN